MGEIGHYFNTIKTSFYEPRGLFYKMLGKLLRIKNIY